MTKQTIDRSDALVAQHFSELTDAIESLRPHIGALTDWGTRLARVLETGGRLLACGNGGSAAQAQHLTAELVGRFEGERKPFSAIALHAETSSLTAVCNDYGIEEMFARQVRAHGRAGDVLLCLSTSGRSPNVVLAAKSAAGVGMHTWALTGAQPNPLASVSDEVIAVDAPCTSTVQEAHLLLIHGLCGAVDRALGVAR